MELFLQYLRQRLPLYAAAAAFCGVFALSFWLYGLPFAALIYPALLCAALAALLSAADFARVKRRHEALQSVRSIMDAAAQSFPETGDIEDRDYREIIRLMAEEHGAFSKLTKQKYADMVDYYTVWAHQIKTPIASMRLHLQNEDSSLSRKLSAELSRVEQYAEMVLTFLRLDSDSSDYVIKEQEIDPIIRQAAKRFSHEFIDRRLSLVYEPLDMKVITDEKWLGFVIEQLLSNALKYTRSGSIRISRVGEAGLRIKDSGIGIAPEDLPRIFEKGYTGYNGRADKRASGIGLYLCRRICAKLGHGISAESVPDAGTAVTLDMSQRRPELE